MSIFVGHLMPKPFLEKSSDAINHSLKDKGFYNISLGIRSKVNVLSQLGFELATPMSLSSTLTTTSRCFRPHSLCNCSFGVIFFFFLHMILLNLNNYHTDLFDP